MPVITTKSSMPWPVIAPCSPARRCRGRPWNGFELLAARPQEAFRRAEVLKDAALPSRPHAGQLVEHRVGHRLVALAAVELDGEPVRLVAHALEQLELDRVVRQPERFAPAGDEDLLDPLRQADDRHAEVAELAEHGEAGGELPAPAVDDDQRGQRGEALVVLLVVRAP